MKKKPQDADQLRIGRAGESSTKICIHEYEQWAEALDKLGDDDADVMERTYEAKQADDYEL